MRAVIESENRKISFGAFSDVVTTQSKDTRNVNPTMLSMAIKISRPTNVRRLSGGRTSSAPTPHVRTRGAGRRGRAWRGPDRAAAHSPGRVERERPVRPVGVVVGGESGEHRPQVLLAEDDQVV